MNKQLRNTIQDRLDRGIVGAEPVGGGSINEAFVATLEGGERVFVKAHARAQPHMFAYEAKGLAWLRESDCIRVPEVIAHGAIDDDEASVHAGFLVLEYIDAGQRRDDYGEELGRKLARLHRSGAETFGLGYDNYLATLVQRNQPCDDWVEFYCTRRLEPLVRDAVDAGEGMREWVHTFSRLFARMDNLVGASEPPARLHGDLWTGNLHTDGQGRPCLIDPAVYGGHREVDLAMLQLFGSPAGRWLEAYEDEYPLAPDYGERIELYQLYPLLAHVCLFGGAYVDGVQKALRRYL